MYEYEDRYTRFTVTPNHNLYQSKLYRTSKDDSYKEERSNWELKTTESYLKQVGISNYCSHLNSEAKGINNIPDEWFFILGAYIGDGGISLKKNKPHTLHISQNENKPLFEKLKRLTNKVYFNRESSLGKNYRFDFKNESLVNWIYTHIGTGSSKKVFPLDVFYNMSEKQFELFFDGLINSDGTTNKHGHMTYYSINKNLIDGLQLFLFSRGIYCQIYTYLSDKSGFKASTEFIYHLNIPRDHKKEYKQLLKKNFKEIEVDDYISCFTVSNGIIITRNKNKIAVQDNSKNMMHLFRLLNMAFNLVFEGEFRVRESEVEWLMEIRNGEIEYDDLIEHSEFLFETINDHFEYSPLQNEPDFEKIKDLIYEFRTNE